MSDFAKMLRETVLRYLNHHILINSLSGAEKRNATVLRHRLTKGERVGEKSMLAFLEKHTNYRPYLADTTKVVLIKDGELFEYDSIKQLVKKQKQ